MKQNAFLTYSWRFLRSNKLEELWFKLEKWLGIRNTRKYGHLRRPIFSYNFPFCNSRQPKPEQNSLMSWLLKILLWRPAFNFWRRAKPMIWHYLSDKKWTKGHLQRKLRSWKISSKLPKSENNDLLRLSRKPRQISEKYLIDLLVINSFDFPFN